MQKRANYELKVQRKKHTDE